MIILSEGGGGMVLMCDPIFRAIDALKDDDAFIIMMTPGGIVYKEKVAYDLSQKKHLIILCGHYEGFDERIKTIVDMEISIGDFVLTGGEIPSMVVMDSVIRLIPGVINSNSLTSESFNDNLLDYPNYTKPVEYRGMKVPDVLLSGHHENINKYRHEKQIELTKKNRPDLLGEKMRNYFINKDNKTGEIVYLEYDKNGYSVSPKAKKKDDIEVNKIVFVSPELTSKLLKKKIDIKINKLLNEYNTIDDDEDDDNGSRLRDKLKEAERLKITILNEYGKYLTDAYIKLTLKKLELIIDGYRSKLYSLRTKKQKEVFLQMFNQIEDNEKKKGRGR